MEVQNDTIFCFTGPSSDASWILPGAVDLYLVISVLSLIKTFYYEKAEIQLLLRNSASPTNSISFGMKSCCPLLPFFFLMPHSPCHCKEMILCLMQHTFLNALPDWLAKDTHSQSTGCEALLPDSLLKNTSEERGEGEETHLPVKGQSLFTIKTSPVSRSNTSCKAAFTFIVQIWKMNSTMSMSLKRL